MDLQNSVLSEEHEESQNVMLVGSRVRRTEDHRLLSGMDQFIDNLKFPDMVFAGFVRSPYAHAKIKRIDLSKISENRSVVVIISPEEVKEKTKPIPVLWRVPSSNIHEHYALAQGKVLHVGDPVVAVAVDDKNKLEDVLESIVIEYEPLEPVLDPSTVDDKPPIHDELGTNTCFAVPLASGDVDRAFNEADVVVSSKFCVPRLAASPMETRGVIATAGGTLSHLTVYSSTQWPHVLRTHLASCLKIDENHLRVIGPDVGGGFGVKGEIYAEEIIVSLMSLKCKRTVKWVESRRESFLSTTHARDQILEASASFKKDGTITGLKVSSTCDFGAYLHTITQGTGFITAISLSGPYKIPNFSMVAKAVYTNKVGLSAYRGFGQPEAALTVERLMSAAASKLGMDPTEIRFKNLVPANEMPYTNITGGVIDSGDYATCLRKALRLANYEDMISRRSEARREGRLYGIGVAFFTETSGFAPGFVFRHLGVELGGYDSATVKMDPQGKVTVTTGAFPHGQGFNTAVSQIVADELGLDLKELFAFHGDTSASPYGHGSFGSRTVAVAGNAALLAARKLKEKILEIGASILQTEKMEDLFLSGGSVRSRSHSKTVPIPQIARRAYLAQDLPKGIEPGLEATVFFEPLGLTTSYGAYIAEVEVDPETGKVKIIKIVAVHDCGNPINPLIVEGQIQGGLAQAVGACLLEEILYDAEGQILTESFIDYLLPTAQGIPELLLDSTCVPTPLNALGSKGVGENGTIIGPPAIANAVSDAIGSEMNVLPMTPEKVWRAINAAKLAK